MPSLWKWLLKGKDKISLSKKQESNEKTEDRYKRTEYFTPNARDNKHISSTDLPSHLQSSCVHDQSRLGNVSPKSEVIEPVPKDEKKEKARQEEVMKHSSDVSKGRLPAYKIFGDDYRPTRNVNKDRGNYQSSSGSDNSPRVDQEKQLFLPHNEKQLFPPHHEKQLFPPHKEKQLFPPHHEKQLFPPHHEKQLFSPHKDKQLFPPHHEKQLFPPHQEKENVDIVGVEMRQKRPDLFNGLASRFHRYSLQMELPGHGSDIRKRPEFTKSETMAGYVPRAVSLHDASAILSGGAMEESLLSKHVNSKVYYLPNPRDSRPRFAYVIPHYMPSSSKQRNQFVTPREHPQNGNHYLSRNIKQSQNKNNKLGKSCSPTSSKSRQMGSNVKSRSPTSSKSRQIISNVKPSSSNDNFYFSCSMLDHIRTGYQDIDSAPSEDTNSLASGDIKEKAAKSDTPLNNSVSELVTNSRDNGGKDSTSRSNNVCLNRTHSGNSQDLSTIIDLDRTSSNEREEDKISGDDDVSSVLTHLEQVVNKSSAPSGFSQLEVIFNTEGEVLY